MSILLDSKVVKRKNIDRDINLKVTENSASERIFVEFSSKDGKLVLQRNYRNNSAGRDEAEEFQSSIKSLEDLKEYFGLTNKEKKCR